MAATIQFKHKGCTGYVKGVDGINSRAADLQIGISIDINILSGEYATEGIRMPPLLRLSKQTGTKEKEKDG